MKRTLRATVVDVRRFFRSTAVSRRCITLNAVMTTNGDDTIGADAVVAVSNADVVNMIRARIGAKRGSSIGYGRGQRIYRRRAVSTLSPPMLTTSPPKRNNRERLSHTERESSWKCGRPRD